MRSTPHGAMPCCCCTPSPRWTILNKDSMRHHDELSVRLSSGRLHRQEVRQAWCSVCLLRLCSGRLCKLLDGQAFGLCSSRHRHGQLLGCLSICSMVCSSTAACLAPHAGVPDNVLAVPAAADGQLRTGGGQPRDARPVRPRQSLCVHRLRPVPGRVPGLPQGGGWRRCS